MKVDRHGTRHMTCDVVVSEVRPRTVYSAYVVDELYSEYAVPVPANQYRQKGTLVLSC